MQTEMHTMLRVRVSLLAITLGTATLGTVHAGWHEFWDRVHLDFHRNNCWMEPFASVDRRAVRAPFETMNQNGWRTQNTLGYDYFHPETQALTEAGEQKLHMIMSNTPEEFRTVYVAQGIEPNMAEKTGRQRPAIVGALAARPAAAAGRPGAARTTWLARRVHRYHRPQDAVDHPKSSLAIVPSCWQCWRSVASRLDDHPLPARFILRDAGNGKLEPVSRIDLKPKLGSADA